MNKYYDILQVHADADAEQIRQAFRRLSMQYHPDRHGGGRYYEEKFKEINEAYQVLKDPIRRWQYRQDSQRAASAGNTRSAWDTPDFAAAHSRPHRRARAYRSGPGRPASAPSPGNFRSVFWSAMLVLVFFLPFMLAERTPANAAGRQWASYEPFDAPATPDSDLKDRLDRRYQRDVALLVQIREADPDLRGLNLETGYYELNGEPVRLSWDVLQLIREKHWKRQ